MKKLIQILILSVLSNSLLAQYPKILTPKLDPNKKSEYISKEFFESLTLEEQTSFLGCLSLFGLEFDSLNWIDSDIIKKISNDSLDCNKKVICKYTNENSYKTRQVEISDNNLPNPKCFVYVERFDLYSRFTFQFYY
jgi:hypothetical protein